MDAALATEVTERVVGPPNVKALYSVTPPKGWSDITNQVQAALGNEGITDGAERMVFEKTEKMGDKSTVSLGPLASKKYALQWKRQIAAPGQGCQVLKFTQSE